ncbi:LuxR family transcriptional regulator [Burkholderiales bacterium 8X]|nr:LuxR family transcriptional regulator [Burkholderiales bacterium 8X]
MTTTWLLDSPPAGHLLDASAVARLLDAGDAPEPALDMLAFVNHVVPVEYISLVEYVGGVPSQVAGHSNGRHHNITGECFALYKKRFRRADELTRLAARMADDGVGVGKGAVTAFLYDVADIPDADWREQIFLDRGLTGRLSFLYSPLPRTLFAINLYRDRDDGRFEEADLARLLGLAPILQRAHRNALFAHQVSPDLDLRTAQNERSLARTAPQLSARERAVCARIACGIGSDGIAAELGVAVATVATLRKRAYAKLAIHGRQQLSRFTC